MILIRFCVAALAYRANRQTSARPPVSTNNYPMPCCHREGIFLLIATSVPLFLSTFFIVEHQSGTGEGKGRADKAGTVKLVESALFGVELERRKIR